MHYFWVAIFLLFIVAITSIHAHTFSENIKIGPLFHFVWGCVYGIPAVILSYLYSSVWLVVAFALERFVFYNIILNGLRHRKMFYVVAENSKPGFWDKIEMWWAGFYPYIWSAGVLGFIYVLIYEL